MTDAPRERVAIFSASVISPIDNPDAYVGRALGRALVASGHDVTLFEERANPALRALLRRAGAGGIADFRQRYPELTYRTIDTPRSVAALVEWLTRTLATIDIAVVQRDTPAQLAAWVGRLTRGHLQTYLLDSGLGVPLIPEALAEREPAAFSGIFVGKEMLVDLYTRWTTPDRIHHFGPLPDLAAPDHADPTDRLGPVATALGQRLLAVAQRDRAGRPAVPEPNHGGTDA